MNEINPMDGIYQPALKNRFMLDVIDLAGDNEVNKIFTVQAIKARINMKIGDKRWGIASVRQLQLEVESEVYGLVAERVSLIEDKSFDMILSVLDGAETSYYKEHFGTCKLSDVSWDYDYAASATVKYLLTFTFDEYKVDRSYWLQASQ